MILSVNSTNTDQKLLQVIVWLIKLLKFRLISEYLEYYAVFVKRLKINKKVQGRNDLVHNNETENNKTWSRKQVSTKTLCIQGASWSAFLIPCKMSGQRIHKPLPGKTSPLGKYCSCICGNTLSELESVVSQQAGAMMALPNWNVQVGVDSFVCVF